VRPLDPFTEDEVETVFLVETVIFPKILLYTFPIFSFTLFCTNLQEYRALLLYFQGSQIVSDTR